MRVTMILKNLSAAFFEGIPGATRGLNNMSAPEKFACLQKNGRDLGITTKVGSGQFRDAVELNALLRGPHAIRYALLPRRGYRIAEFIVSAAPGDRPPG